MPDDRGSPPWRLLETDAEPPKPTPSAATPTVARATLEAPQLRILAILGLAGALALVAFFMALGSGDGDGVVVSGGAAIDAGSGVNEQRSAGPSDAAIVVVEVAGAVTEPGVFRVPQGSRVGDLIALAGGYGPRVDVTRVDAELNLAAVVTDGARIRVPSRDDVPLAPDESAGSGDLGGAPTGELVDLNSASAAQLETLPGIGPVTAEKIIAAREEAPFTSVDELRSRGILGEKTFEQLRALVRAG